MGESAADKEAGYQTSVAKQTTLNDLSHKFGGSTPVRVHFMDNSSKMFLLDNSILVRDVTIMVMQKLGIGENEPLAIAPYFGLFESSDSAGIGNALSADTVLVNTVQNWANHDTKLVFMIRMFMPSLWGIEYRDEVARRLNKPPSFLSSEVYLDLAEVTDEDMLRIQYIQAIYNVITGQYQTSMEQILKLSSYQFFYKFGAYKHNVHKSGFLNDRIVEFIPLSHLKEKGFEECENLLFNYIKDTAQYEYTHTSLIEAQRKYLDEIYMLPMYGNTLFKCDVTGLADPNADEDEDNSKKNKEKYTKKVFLGIHHMGISIYDRTVLKKEIASFSLGELQAWGYHPTSGSLTVKLPKSCEDHEGKPYDELDYSCGGVLEFSFSAKSEVSNNNANSNGNGDGDLGRGGGSYNASNASTGSFASDLLVDYAVAFQREEVFENTRTEVSHNSSGVGSKEHHAEDRHSVIVNNYIHDAIPGMESSDADAAEEVEHGTIHTAPVGIKVTSKAQLAKEEAAAMHKRELENQMDPAVAAVLIQKRFRGYSLRVEWIREGCAELLQAVWRGHRARLLVSDMIHAMIEEGAMLDGLTLEDQ